MSDLHVAERLLVSHPSPDGSVAVVRFPPGSALTVSFVDELVPRDISDLAADLLLIGLAATASGDPLPDPDRADDTVVVGQVLVVGDPPEVLFVHPGAQLCRRVVVEDLVELVTTGVAMQVTAGVASARDEMDAAHLPVPGSGRELSSDGPGEG